MEKLTVLCTAISEMGHMNGMIGVAIALKKRGHRVVFATERSWKGKLELFGLDEELFDEKETVEKEAGKQWGDHLAQFEQMMSRMKPEEKLGMLSNVFTKLIDAAEFCNPQLQKIVRSVKPDVIIEDYGLPLPAFIEANVPIIKFYSAAPLIAFNDHRLPPFGFGLPLNDKSEWQRYREIFYEYFDQMVKPLGEWMDKALPQVPKLPQRKLYKSTNLNIYMYPKSLVDDYLKLCPLGDEWIGVDHCLREPFGDFQVPQKLRNRVGKLIFFSLGSMGSSFVGLMQRLIGILAKSKHNFIVSTGYRSEEFKLSENMWGEQFLPQLAVLPHVDLVLTHGGNNSYLETLYFAKPMIVFPLFGDQYENAQRAVELNIGYRFDPFVVTETELNESIDKLLLDENVEKNVKRISKEMRESKAMESVIEKIEYVVKFPKFPTIQ